MKIRLGIFVLVLISSLSPAIEASPFDGNWKQVASVGAGHDCDAIKTKPCG